MVTRIRSGSLLCTESMSYTPRPLPSRKIMSSTWQTIHNVYHACSIILICNNKVSMARAALWDGLWIYCVLVSALLMIPPLKFASLAPLLTPFLVQFLLRSLPPSRRPCFVPSLPRAFPSSTLPPSLNPPFLHWRSLPASIIAASLPLLSPSLLLSLPPSLPLFLPSPTIPLLPPSLPPSSLLPSLHPSSCSLPPSPTLPCSLPPILLPSSLLACPPHCLPTSRRALYCVAPIDLSHTRGAPPSNARENEDVWDTSAWQHRWSWLLGSLFGLFVRHNACRWS